MEKLKLDKAEINCVQFNDPIFKKIGETCGSAARRKMVIISREAFPIIDSMVSDGLFVNANLNCLYGIAQEKLHQILNFRTG